MQGSSRQAHHYMQQTVPETVGAWRAASPDGVYDGSTLFEYINGGAEVYKWLGLKLVLARKYTAKGKPDLIVDIFDMGAPDNAFGAYHNDTREGKSAAIGAESEMGEASLAFWKGSFFVSIIAFDSGPEVTTAIRQLGTHIAKRITEGSPAPALLSVLPKDVIASNRFHFFHGHESLNALYYLSTGNPLGLSMKTDGLLARLTAKVDGKTVSFPLVVVLYPDEGAAKKAEARTAKSILAAPEGELSVRLDNGLRGRVAQVGRVLVLLMDVPDAVDLNKVVAQIRNNVLKLK